MAATGSTDAAEGTAVADIVKVVDIVAGADSIAVAIIDAAGREPTAEAAADSTITVVSISGVGPELITAVATAPASLDSHALADDQRADLWTSVSE